MRAIVLSNNGEEARIELENGTRITFWRNTSPQNESVEQFFKDFPVGHAPCGSVELLEGEAN